MKRTHLPLNGLRVLDAAARHLSFTRAADELAVTPAAVGQQIRALEDTLGVVLFRRTTRGLELTNEGEAGLAALRDGFMQFEEAVRAMQAGQSSKALAIAAPREVIEKWLLPRLAEIAATDAELRFALVTADDGLDFTEANLDLAIRWGEGPGALEGEAIESEGLVTVAAPAGGVAAAIGWPGGPDGDGAIRVGDAGLAIDAAAAGLGRATVPELLATRDIAAGRVTVVGAAEPSRFGYWLVAPTPQWRQKKVQALVEALAGVSALPVLTTARLVLRARTPDDAEAMFATMSDADAMRWWSRAPVATVEELREQFATSDARSDWRGWSIVRAGSDRAIGFVAAGEKRQGGVSELGYLLARDAWGQGIAREAVSALIDRLFAEGQRRVFADTDPENDASNALLARLGFTREGLLRGEWETHIGVRDSVIWGLLRGVATRF